MQQDLDRARLLRADDDLIDLGADQLGELPAVGQVRTAEEGAAGLDHDPGGPDVGEAAVRRTDDQAFGLRVREVRPVDGHRRGVDAEQRILAGHLVVDLNPAVAERRVREPDPTEHRVCAEKCDVGAGIPRGGDGGSHRRAVLVVPHRHHCGGAVEDFGCAVEVDAGEVVEPQAQPLRLGQHRKLAFDELAGAMLRQIWPVERDGTAPGRESAVCTGIEVAAAPAVVGLPCRHRADQHHRAAGGRAPHCQRDVRSVNRHSRRVAAGMQVYIISALTTWMSSSRRCDVIWYCVHSCFRMRCSPPSRPATGPASGRTGPPAEPASPHQLRVARRDRGGFGSEPPVVPRSNSCCISSGVMFESILAKS